MTTKMQRSVLAVAIAIGTMTVNLTFGQCAAAQQSGGKKPNILVIMGDDVGWFNVGAYHQGIMSGKTPNLDELARQGMRFTDYYAEASCTAGRANFITGEIPLRTGLTTVGQAGADVGMPAQACTLATALKAQGYATGQFGKNHLGDLNKFLPTVHGFDEFFGYLYHLDAMSDPYWYSFPDRREVLQHVWPTQSGPLLGRPIKTTQPKCRAGVRSASREIVDEGPLPPFPDMSNVPNMHDLPFLKAKYDMTTFDEVLVEAHEASSWIKAKQDGKPFFVWHNTTRMHVWTFLSEKYKAMQNNETNYGLEEAGMAQIDDCVGALMKHLDDIGEADNTIVIFTTDNGAETFTWPDGGILLSSRPKRHRLRRRIPRSLHHPLAGQDQSRARSKTESFPASIGSPRLMAAAGNPNITDQLLKGVKLGDRTYKNHLDGYDQTGPPHRQGAHPSDMSCSTLPDPTGRAFVSTTSNSSSSSSLRAGPDRRSRPTCPRS